MTQPKEYYIKRIVLFKADLQKQKKTALIISSLRLILFLLLVFFLYRFHQSTGQILLTFFIWIPLFLYLISKSVDISRKIKKTKVLIDINESEIQVLNGYYEHLPKGDEFIDPQHDYSYDIDLFGDNSFFQYLNRSIKQMPQKLLADFLTANQITGIKDKQEAVKDLSQRPGWRQNFMAESQLVTDTLTPEKISLITGQLKYFTKPLFFYAAILFSIISLGIIAGFYLKTIPTKILIYWSLAGLSLVGFFAKKIHRLYQSLDLIMPSLTAYSKLLKLIEKEDFKSGYLKRQKTFFKTGDNVITKELDTLIKIYGQKEMTNNMIIKFLGNALFLSDLIFAYKLEKWLKIHQNRLAEWLSTVDFFEAQISLGNFDFNHPGYTYPELIDDQRQIDAHELGHPLITAQKRINNDFAINRHEFFIITGANMAGKSTFLRTVSMSIVMANTGLPVCANSFLYRPIKLMTSMRTSDSLQSESSYFFSELKRLQYIVEHIETDDYFIVLDEILKGTNSTDKAIGSKKFIERLTHSKATGIIATHDLSLCVLADTYPQIKNYFFDAEIVDDELYFDYTLKNGICQNMNASFLLKKMNII